MRNFIISWLTQHVTGPFGAMYERLDENQENNPYIFGLDSEPHVTPVHAPDTDREASAATLSLIAA